MTEYDFSDYQSSDYNEPYHDPDVLRRLYWDDDLSMAEMAEVFDVADTTICRHMNRAGVDTEEASPRDERYHDADTLRSLYWEEGLTTNDLAERFDVDRSTIVRAMDRVGVETRDMSDYDPDEYTKVAHRARRTHPQLSTTLNGYERIRHREQEFKLHRLAAVAWFGTGVVKGDHIHHENGIPWDNREDNLRPMVPEKHNRHHANERRDPETGRFV